MDWNEIIYKTIALVLTILGSIFTYYCVPILKAKAKEITEKLSDTQKETAKYWVKVFVQFAEQKYQEANKGKEKKQYVIDMIREKGFNVLSDEELSALIDLAVEEFKLKDWQVEI